MPVQIDDELIPLQRALSRTVDGDVRYENSMYYRQPKVWEQGTPRERVNPHADWITRAGNNRERMADLIERGFVPLRKFGVTQKNPQWSKEAQGTPDQYGPWGVILSHPEGPSAFPVSQVLTYRWYDPRHCPVPGVTFPQLAGREILEYTCPDCTDRVFGEAIHLGRHLRGMHNWGVEDVLRFGEAMGLDFRREFTRDAKRVVRYEPPEAAAGRAPLSARPAVPPPTVERIVPVRSDSASAGSTTLDRAALRKRRAQDAENARRKKKREEAKAAREDAARQAARELATV